MRFARQYNGLLAAAIVVGVAGCSAFQRSTAPDAKATATSYGQVAPLRAIGGSAVSGKIRVIDRGNGASVLVSLMNIPPGDFRIAFHETPNCSSPNGFSAGPAWAPSGLPAASLIPTQHANSEDRVESSLRVAGLHAGGTDGVAGRSVIVYAGNRVADARPDVPNDAIACGVFEPAQPLAF